MKSWHHLGTYSIGSIRKSCLVQSTQPRYPVLPPFPSLIHVKTHPVSKIMYSVMSAWWWAKTRHLVLLCIIIPSKFIQKIHIIYNMERQEGACGISNKKCGIQYSTYDTGRAKCANPNILQWNDIFWPFYGHFIYTDTFSSPDEVLWCG